MPLLLFLVCCFMLVVSHLTHWKVVTYCKKVSNSNGKSDGKASRASEVCAFGIAAGEDSEDQLERDEELHQKAVSNRDLGVHLWKRLSGWAATS